MATPGDIALIAYSADNKSFSFVLLADLSGQTISFTDNGWLAAGGFRTGEGTVTYTVPAGTQLGTVVTIDNLTGQMNPSASGDQIIAYTGTAASPSFLFALDFADGNTTYAGNATNSNTSAVPTGLTYGTTALGFGLDNGAYTGPTTGTKAEILANIADANNWTTNDTTSVAPVNGFSVGGGNSGNPAGVFAVNDVSVAEGDAGTTTMTFTVTRAGGSTGEVTVDFATHDGTATAGSDYVAKTGTLSFAAGETSKTVAITINGDTVAEGNETLQLNLTNATGGATIADAQGIGTITNDDAGVTHFIHDIQGPAFFSPILAAEGITAFNVASAASVTVRGVVTAIDSFLGSGIQGFYISEEVADWDNNANTSEGIFVRTSGATAGLTVGETVTVTAKVMEYQDFSNLNKTMLVNASSIIQSNDSVALPTFVIDGTPGHKIPTNIISDDNPVFTDSTGASGTFDPQNDALDYYETLEGMRVTVKDMVVADGFVGGSNDDFVYFNAYSAANADPALINSRGGYTITGDPQHYPIDTPGTDDDVKYGGATVTDGAQHGDILEVDFGNVGRGGTASFDQDLTMGDKLGDVTGIIDFDFGVTKLYVTDALDPTKVAELANTTPVQEVTTLTGEDARALRIATFNVENLSPVGTTFSTNNGVEISTQAKFDKLAANIATNLDSPDIIVIEEVQDNNGVTQDGVTDASTTWTQLVNAVNAATGKHYQWVDEAPITSGDVGGAPGGNIRTGFLYNTDRVSLGDLSADATLAERREYTDRIGDGVRTAGDKIAVDDSGLGINPSDWSGTRRSIVGEFNFNGQTIYVFGNHLPSKGGSDDPYEIGQNNGAGLPANGDWALRSTLAQDLWQVQNKAAQIADAKIVSGGDFNEFWFNRPLEVATGYANPDGTANTSGGATFSNLMVDKLAPVDRFSYDFDGRSEALDTILSSHDMAGVASYDVVHINTGYNDRAGAVNPASSDHDPSLASFDMRAFAETLKGTTGNDVLEGFGGNDTLTGNGGNDTLDGGEGTDTAVFSGNYNGYSRSFDGTSFTITGNEGTATVKNVELFQFADRTYTVEELVGSAPVFTSPSEFTVNENQSFAAQLVATDADAGTTLLYTITGGDDADLFTINGQTGAITFKQAPDFEAPADAGHNNVYNIDVAASDGGLVAEASLAITVADVVETPPLYTLQLLHFSDAEAGLLAGTTAPRLAALVDAFEDKYVNSITLASGDLFIPGPFLAAGTDASLATLVPGNSNPGRVDISIMNAIGVQASTLGNHEFDLGSNVLASAITGGSGYAGALYPLISANLDYSGDSALKPLYIDTTATPGLEDASTLKGKLVPSAVLTENGEKIGIVGVTTQVLEAISSPSGTEVKGFPTGPGANGEVNDMALLAAQLQPVIDDLLAQGINKVILLSHLQQIELEEALAPLLKGVDIIIAGGSNTRLGDANDQGVDFPGHSAQFDDSYPVVTAGADGKTTLIVNTDSEYTYLGRLVVDFDQNGEITADSVSKYTNVSGAYASTDENVAAAWNTTVDNLATTAFATGTRGGTVKTLTDAVDHVIEVKDGNIFGYSNVYLEGERSQVRTQETNLGDLSADANAAVARKALGLSDDIAVVSVKNGGGIRAQIGTLVNNPDGTVTKVPPEVGGEVSQLDVENALRFDNKLMVFNTTAQGLLNILNSPNALAPNNGGFIQIGGVRFSYDPTKAAGSRVQDVVLVNQQGLITAVIADNGVVNANAPALIQGIVLNFTANGGDGYLFKQNADNFRYLKTDGTLSAAVDESLDFTATATINSYAGSTTNLLGEQKAFEDYMSEYHGTHETAFNQADVGQDLDTRIQNQTARADTVLEGQYLFLGTAAHETLQGTVGNDVIKGLSGNDKLLGLAGDDVLLGGLGADRLDGGIGNDTASYADATSGVEASLKTKTGTFGEALGDVFVSIENLTGSSHSDILAGDGKVNIIHGGAGDDVILGNGGADLLFGDAGNDRFLVTGTANIGSFDGGEGFDTIEAAADNTKIVWNSLTTTSIEAIDGRGYANVTITGSAGADTLDFSGLTVTRIDRIDGLAGNDTIIGSAGADVIVGGKGIDTMTGGAGADLFVFAAGDTGKTTATADTITDFLSGMDKIDLSAIDAVSGKPDNEPFAFIGTAAFGRHAGELRYEVINGDAWVSGDTNGDAKADFMLHLAHVSTLTAVDFVL